MSSGVYIIGNRNKVTPDATGVVLVNCHDMEIDSTYNDKTVLASGRLVVDELGVSNAVYAPYADTLVGDATITADKRQASFFLDASGGNTTITIYPASPMRIFTRIDSSGNTLTLVPSSGLISGQASYSLSANESVIIISDLTNQYIISGGGSSPAPSGTGDGEIIDMGDRLIGNAKIDNGNRV